MKPSSNAKRRKAERAKNLIVVIQCVNNNDPDSSYEILDIQGDKDRCNDTKLSAVDLLREQIKDIGVELLFGELPTEGQKILIEGALVCERCAIFEYPNEVDVYFDYKEIKVLEGKRHERVNHKN